MRDGWARPASLRFFRGEPGDALTRLAGALTACGVRGKSPVACGKSSGGMSAPSFKRWQSRQYGTSSRQSCKGPSLPLACWSVSKSAQSLASIVERSTAHRKSRKWRFSSRSASRSASRASRWRPFVVHSPPVILGAPRRRIQCDGCSSHRKARDPPSWLRSPPAPNRRGR